QDGTVWTWGDNTYGQLGIGSVNGYALTPVQVLEQNGQGFLNLIYTPPISISMDPNTISGGDVPLLVNFNLSVSGGLTPLSYNWDFGDGQSSTLQNAYHTYMGIGNYTAKVVVTDTVGQTVEASLAISTYERGEIACGPSHTVALKQDGTVWAWGKNEYGQLGDGTQQDRLTPVQVSGISNVIDIEAGLAHTIALKEDGTVWAWGKNDVGQLGDGTTINRSTPVQVSGLSNVAAIANRMALKQDGTVWTWGQNNFGQIGNGTINNDIVLTPVQVQECMQGYTRSLSNVIAIASSRDHKIALKQDGTVWGWGDGSLGVFGDRGGAWDYHSFANPIDGFSKIISIATGLNHTVALRQNGTVWACGWNHYGQVGSGKTTDRLIPSVVSDISDVIAISAGDDHTIALKKDGTVWTWGKNTSGQLGDGTTTNRLTPVQVAGISNVAAISGGEEHTVVLKQDGTVWAWGRNDDGQLGDGTTTNRLTPVQVVGENGQGFLYLVPPPPSIGTFQFEKLTDTIAENAGTIFVNVTRTGGAYGTLTATYSITDGTAINGVDFQAPTSGIITWDANDTSTKTIPISILSNSSYALSRNFTVTLLESPGRGSPYVQTITISDIDTPKASITINIYPREALGSWSIYGGDGSWHSSGETVEFAVNTNTNEDIWMPIIYFDYVEFYPIYGWQKPSIIPLIGIQAGEKLEIDSFYIQNEALLQVNIKPEEANIAGARWMVDNDGVWRKSGERKQVAVSEHTITFNEVYGWDNPEDQIVAITEVYEFYYLGIVSIPQDAIKEVEYTNLTGSISVTISPEEVWMSEPMWRIDNGEWLQSGEVLSGLMAGSYTLECSSVPNWNEPQKQTVIITAGQQNDLSVEYQKSITFYNTSTSSSASTDCVGLVHNDLFSTDLDIQQLHNMNPYGIETTDVPNILCDVNQDGVIGLDLCFGHLY
nr:PKD domain-containing protein [Desulfobacterales bacterium]